MSSAAGIRAGRAYVEIGTNNTALDRGLAAAQAKLQALGQSATRIGGIIAGGGTAVLAPLVASAFGAAKTGDELNKMADRTGASVEALSELKHAAEQSDVEFDALGKGMQKMQRNIVEAGEGVTTASEAFEKLGIPLDTLNSMSPDQQFEAISDAISRLDDPAKRTAAAMEVFGKSGADMLPLMSAGSKGISLLRKEARDLGLQVSTKDAQAATLFGDTWSNFQKVIKDVSTELGMALLPVLTEVTQQVIPLVVHAAKWISENRGLVVSIAALAVGMIAAGGVIASIGVGATIAASAIGGLATVLGVVASPLGLVVIGVTAAASAFLLLTESGQALTQWAGTELTKLGAIASQAFGGIANALKSGDLALAGKIAFTGLKLAAVTVLDSILQVFDSSIDKMMLKIQQAFTAFQATVAIMNAKTLKSDALNQQMNQAGTALKATTAVAGMALDSGSIQAELDAMTAEAQSVADKVANQTSVPTPDGGKSSLGKFLGGVTSGLKNAVQSGAQHAGSFIDSLRKKLEEGQVGLEEGLANSSAPRTSSASGTFNAATAAFSLGGNLQQRMLTAQERTARNTDPKNQRPLVVTE